MHKNSNESPGEKILQTWKKLQHKPFGKYLFSRSVGNIAPYTGSIKALITDLHPGYCQTYLKQRRSNMNHLNSIHAIALINLGELTSGLAVLSGLSNDVRGILTQLSMEYPKKSKGHLTADCTCDIPEVVNESLTHQVTTIIRNSDRETVAIGTFTWLLSKTQ